MSVEAQRDEAVNELAGLRATAEYLVNHIPGAVRVREGGGHEDIDASLSVSVLALVEQNARFRACLTALGLERPEELTVAQARAIRDRAQELERANFWRNEYLNAALVTAANFMVAAGLEWKGRVAALCNTAGDFPGWKAKWDEAAAEAARNHDEWRGAAAELSVARTVLRGGEIHPGEGTLAAEILGELDRLGEEWKAAAAERDRLKAVLEADPEVLEFTPEQGLSVRHATVKYMALSVEKTFAELGGENYAVVNIGPTAAGNTFEVTIRKNDGLTPISKLSADLGQARAACRKMVEAAEYIDKGGCLSHLDCAPDGGRKWYEAVAAAREVADKSPEAR